MLGGLDLVIFIGSLVAVMAVGLIAGRKEDSSEDFFLAGRTIPWWGVAGSIFGTNVSANHLVGMLGVGFSIGFAQSHYELGAVAALLILAYVFLPVYARLKIFTLSEYLSGRFGNLSSLLYSVTLIILIIVQMTAAFYIGSRSLNLLVKGTGLEMGYEWGVVILVLITTIYTIFGGLKAVIWTDVIQSVLLLIAGLLVAAMTFATPEVGGFMAMLSHDQTLPAAQRKMSMYLSSDHPDLPWTGALTGLMMLHVFYWGTNQYIVQRALAAKNAAHARTGILTGSFFKLLIPFFSIAGGVAAAQLFTARSIGQVAPDEAFPILVRLIVPAGYGLVGLIAAGLMGAIISSIDSMMNSAATLTTIDIYKKYVKPDADDARLILVGRIAIAAIVAVSALGAVTTYDPKSSTNFFLKVSAQSSYFTPGLVAAFLMGMFRRRANAKGAIAAIIAAPFAALFFEFAYNNFLASYPFWSDMLGAKLNFMHRTFLAFLCTLLIMRLFERDESDPERERFSWSNASGYSAEAFRNTARKLPVFVLGVGAAGFAAWWDRAWAPWAAGLGALFVFALYLAHILKHAPGGEVRENPPPPPMVLLRDDRLYAGILCALTIWIMIYFV